MCCAFPEQSADIIGEEHPQPHHGQVFRHKLHGRLLVIKKDEHTFQEQIVCDAVLPKGIATINGNAAGRYSEHGGSGGIACLEADGLSQQSHYDAPVKSQMGGKKNEAPVSAEHMQHSRKGHPAPDGEKSKDIPAHHDPADHGAQHGKEHQNGKDGLEYPKGEIDSTSKVSEAPQAARVKESVFKKLHKESGRGKSGC